MPTRRPEKIWMAGELGGGTRPKVHVLTHSRHYGSGVFEGIRTTRPPTVRPSSASPTTPAAFDLRQDSS